MADVRDILDYNEQDVEALTFNYDSSIVIDTSRYDLGSGWSTPSFTAGVVVALVSDSTAGLGSSGGYPLGILLKVEGTKCSVQCHGTMWMAYNVSTNPPIVGRGVQVNGAGLAISPTGGVRLATERGIVLSLNASASPNPLAKVYFGA